MTLSLHIVNFYADSGARNIYFCLKDVATYKVATKSNIRVTQADGNTMKYAHITNINWPTLSSTVKLGHVIPTLSSISFLFIGKLCDDNCLTLFTKEEVFIFQQNKLFLKENEIISMTLGLFQFQFN